MRVPLSSMLFRHAPASDDDLKVAMEELWALRTEVAAAERAAQSASANTQCLSATPSSPYTKTAVILRPDRWQNRADRQ
jgi:hypothetical protein